MRQPVIVEIEGREPMRGDADIVWPESTDGLAEWSVEVKGNEDLYFAREFVELTLVQPWNGVRATGRAMPIKLVQVFGQVELALTFQGDGPLERQQ